MGRGATPADPRPVRALLCNLAEKRPELFTVAPCFEGDTLVAGNRQRRALRGSPYKPMHQLPSPNIKVVFVLQERAKNEFSYVVYFCPTLPSDSAHTLQPAQFAIHCHTALGLEAIYGAPFLLDQFGNLREPPYVLSQNYKRWSSHELLVPTKAVKPTTSRVVVPLALAHFAIMESDSWLLLDMVQGHVVLRNPSVVAQVVAECAELNAALAQPDSELHKFVFDRLPDGARLYVEEVDDLTSSDEEEEAPPAPPASPPRRTEAVAEPSSHRSINSLRGGGINEVQAVPLDLAALAGEAEARASCASSTFEHKAREWEAMVNASKHEANEAMAKAAEAEAKALAFEAQKKEAVAEAVAEAEAAAKAAAKAAEDEIKNLKTELMKMGARLAEHLPPQSSPPRKRAKRAPLRQMEVAEFARLKEGDKIYYGKNLRAAKPARITSFNGKLIVDTGHVNGSRLIAYKCFAMI